MNMFSLMTHIMRCIRVVIDATEKRRCCIFPDVLGKIIASSRVIIEKVRNVMNKS